MFVCLIMDLTVHNLCIYNCRFTASCSNLSAVYHFNVYFVLAWKSSNTFSEFEIFELHMLNLALRIRVCCNIYLSGS